MLFDNTQQVLSLLREGRCMITQLCFHLQAADYTYHSIHGIIQDIVSFRKTSHQQISPLFTVRKFSISFNTACGTINVWIMAVYRHVCRKIEKNIFKKFPLQSLITKTCFMYFFKDCVSCRVFYHIVVVVERIRVSHRAY